jgi:hypothetical protein
MIKIQITDGARNVESYKLDGTVLTRGTGGVTDFGDYEVLLRFLLANIRMDINAAKAAQS